MNAQTLIDTAKCFVAQQNELLARHGTARSLNDALSASGGLSTEQFQPFLRGALISMPHLDEGIFSNESALQCWENEGGDIPANRAFPDHKFS